MGILFKNARVAKSTSEDLINADVLIESGEIQAVGSDLESSDSTRELDVGGKILLPGLFDLHAHLREPGQEAKETIETGSEAAINGGITGLLAMPNTDPAVDTGSMVDFIQDIAEDDSRISVMTSGCITKNRDGNELAEIGDMKEKGAPLITDDGNPVANAQVMRRAMEYARNFDLVVADHCETPDLAEEGAVTEGPVSYRLGLPGQPRISEEICIERDLRLARLTGARYHVQHLSTADGLESVCRFRDQDVDVTCEVTPHHLLFSYEDLDGHDTSLKMNPPLRREKDRQTLIEGLAEGNIDVLATDHAPHAGYEKRRDFNSAPFGITGLETALVSLYDRLISSGKLGWNRIVETFSRNPRELIGRDPVTIEEGSKVNLVLFDPDSETHFNRDFFQSKSMNSPFLDETLQGEVTLVLRGDEVLLDRHDRLQ